jgi:hypothetical protein
MVLKGKELGGDKNIPPKRAPRWIAAKNRAFGSQNGALSVLDWVLVDPCIYFEESGQKRGK